MTKLIITGWQVGLNKIAMTKLIQGYTSLGLSAAKSVTDRVLDGETVTLAVDGKQEAASLAAQLTAIGVEAGVAWE